MTTTTKNIVTLIAVAAIVIAFSSQSEAGCHGHGHGGISFSISRPSYNNYQPRYQPTYRQPTYVSTPPNVCPSQQLPPQVAPYGQPQQPGQPFVQGQPQQQGQPFAQGQPQQQGQPFTQGQPRQQGQPFAQGQPQQQGKSFAQGQPQQQGQPQRQSQGVAQQQQAQQQQAQQQQAQQQQAQQQRPTAKPQTQTPATVNAETSALEALGGFAPPQSEETTPVSTTTETLPAHVGRWSAKLSNGASIQLDLNANGSFNWSAINKDGRTSSFQGSYQVNNGSLTLIRSDNNQSLAGSLETSSSNAFSFQLADKNAAKLEFVRA